MKKVSNDITLLEIEKIIQGKSAWKVVQSLLDKGLVIAYENMQDRYEPKMARYIFLQPAFHEEENLKGIMNALEKAPKQLDLLLCFLHLHKTQQHVVQADLIKQANANAAQLKQLIDKGVLMVKEVEVDRILFEADAALESNALSPEQENAVKEINEGFEQHQTVLLHGITGSGKTHVYIRLIEDCIRNGKQALYLLPEIALTAQLVSRLRKVLGNRIGVYHSRFSNHERLEVWQKIQEGAFDIVIGARSALLLPFKNLGLVIVDEEHDSSYKQHDPAPRYHARDCAIFLAHSCKANVLMGSATPSVESYYHATQGKYKLVELKARYGSGELPVIELIDTKQTLMAKQQEGIFSTRLLEQIKLSLSQKRQVILFQNRRGYSPLVLCTACGWIPHCKYCDVSLTYHKGSDQLHCHYCGSRSPYMKICAACGGTKIVARSFGTEKIEDDIKKYFPYARVERFDWDALKSKNKYQEIISAFEKRQIDILVGTQMLVKGLDFEFVNLVGVLSADSLLSHPDFRVNERVFQLLEQVSGRAGRKDKEGKVFIQLFNTQHPVIQFVKSHDFKGYFQAELMHRKEYQYPPYTRLMRITLKHKKQEVVQMASMHLAAGLAALPKSLLFGPAEPGVSRIRNYYLQEILLKMNKDLTVVNEVKRLTKQKIVDLLTTRNFSTVIVQLDVDPY